MFRMSKMPPLTMSHRLTISREQADLGVTAMAQIMGVSRNTIGRWESSKSPHLPTLGQAKQWAAETGSSLAYLLGEVSGEVVVVTPEQLERRRTSRLTRGRTDGYRFRPLLACSLAA